MEANKQVREIIIHDLNQDPRLPFNDSEFDACICNISAEYLVDPFSVFMNVARTLKQGAPFIVTFSDRWFPLKVIKLWTELHPFERTGLVLEYFRNSSKFGELSTESVRGYPRPVADKHFPDKLYSDPVLAVWGKRI
jgi:SAM-dependent methyltransferase